MAGSFALGDDGYSGFFFGEKERLKVEGDFLFLENTGELRRNQASRAALFPASDRTLKPTRSPPITET
ncbi:hypothetical protein [Burkholderia gladioli]|uniref:hypothetical protein n=1 Tax=Burkholderia gladioli TaxID=28095 RepID=UPI00164157D6|nr:hypothetical protein [Burkholderia gladioli]